MDKLHTQYTESECDICTMKPAVNFKYIGYALHVIIWGTLLLLPYMVSNAANEYRIGIIPEIEFLHGDGTDQCYYFLYQCILPLLQNLITGAFGFYTS